MECGSVNDLSRYRFEKAQRNLEVARTLFQSRHFSVAQNRAYYAAFDAIRAVNALDGFDSSKHSGVIAHFNQNYVKTGRFPSGTSGVIRKAAMLREKSDYEDFYEADAEDTEETIIAVQGFMADVEQYLTGKGMLPA